MRESFGGTFMIYLFLIFIVIYITFMGVAINYAKVFRVKNNVINIVEQNQFVFDDGDDAIDNYLAGVPYLVNNDNVVADCGGVTYGNKNEDFMLTDRGICIEKKGDPDRFYYEVTAYISIAFPFFDLYFTVPIRGETKLISF